MNRSTLGLPVHRITVEINEIKNRITIERINGAKNCFFEKVNLLGMSLVVWWLRLRAPKAGGPGSNPGQGAGSRMSQLRVPALPGASVRNSVHGKDHEEGSLAYAKA